MRLNVKVAAVALSLIILLLLVVYADPVKFAGIVAGSNYNFLIMAFAVSTATVLIRILKWKILVGNVSYSSITPVQLLGITISNFSPGKIAEPVKGIILKVKEGIAVSTSLPSIIWERILDVLSLIILALLGAYFFMALDPQFYIISLISIAAFVVILAAALLVLYKKSFADWVFGILKRFPITNRISRNFIKTFEKSKVSKPRIVCSFILTFIAWLLEGVILYFALLSIGIQLSPIMLASIFALSSLIGFVTALPGGIGSTDVVLTIFIGYFGVEKSLAVAGILLARFLSIWYINLLGGISLIYLIRKMKISYKSIIS